MEKYAIEYIQEIKPEYISDVKVYIYELNINYFNTIEELKEKFKTKKEFYKINSLEKVPYNLRKFYDEYGFYIDKNKIYSVTPILDSTIESITDTVGERITAFIDRESENLESLDLDLENLFEGIEVNKYEVSLFDLEYLKEENEKLFNNLLKSKFTLNTCFKSFNIPYLIEDANGDIIKKGKSGQKDKIYKKVNKELQFMPIYGKSGEMFTSEFIEDKAGKAVLKLKADVVKKGDKLFFKYTMIFSELIKNPVEYRDLFSDAWKDYSELINGKIPRKQRTFYLKNDNGFVPIKLRRVYTLDYSRLENHEDLKFTYEFEDADLSSKIEEVFGYDLKEMAMF